MDAVTLTLGLTVSKIVLQRWIGNGDIANSVISSFEQILGRKTSDLLARRRGARQFETLGEKIAEQFDELLSNELDEGGREAVVHSVIDALNRSSLKSDDLIRKNLNPISLAESIVRDYDDLTDHFSLDEKQIFRLLINQSCQQLILLSAQLPTFDQDVFTEILERENEIIRLCATMLERLQAIQKVVEKSGLPENDAVFEASYKATAAKRLDVVQLFGVDVTDTSRRQKLSVAYISLRASQANTLPRIGLTLDNVQPEDDDRNSQPELLLEPQSVESILSKSRRLLIKGYAGSGKTTLLQWAGVTSATGAFDHPLSAWNDTVPFFFPLRGAIHTNRLVLPSLSDLVALNAPIDVDSMPNGWVRRQFASGRALLLIDGLDEVPSRHRNDLRIWLTDIARDFPETRILLTSRPHAVDEYWMDDLGFGFAELKSMESPDIRLFVDNWHKAVADQLNDSSEIQYLGELASMLKNKLRLEKPLRQLATSPLLCAMLCALHRHRRQQLPTDRIELYEACCHMLIERREMERSVPYDDYPNLNYRQKRMLLEDFAYWLIRNGQSQATLEDSEERLSYKLGTMTNLPSDATPEQVRRLLVERTSIVREPVLGVIDFAHRTFQEFLAARVFEEQGDRGLLVSNAHDDQWREVVILTAAMASQRFRSDLLRRIIVSGDRSPRRRHKLHMLAVACLDSTLEIEPEIKQDINERLKALIPPRSFEDVKDLASAGDLAIPYLRVEALKRISSSSAATRRVTECLARIGGDAALAVFEEIASSVEHPEEASFLLSCWFEFEPVAEFGRRLIPMIFGDSVRVSAVVPCLDGFESLSRVEVLSLSTERVTDLQQLESMQSIRALQLIHVDSVENLTAIGRIGGLQELWISGVQDSCFLEDAMSIDVLRKLSLSWADQADSVHWLELMPELKALELHGMRWEDASILKKVSKIERLYLSSGRDRYWQPQRRAGLGGTVAEESWGSVFDELEEFEFEHLRFLSLSGSPYVKLLSRFATLHSVESLAVTGRDAVVDTLVLNRAVNLKELSVIGSLRVAASDLKMDESRLETLLIGGDIADVGAILPRAKHLRELRVVSEGFNLELLNYCGGLRTLEIGGWSEVKGVGYDFGRRRDLLEGPMYLEADVDWQLSLGGYRDCLSISALEYCVQLNALSLFGFDRVQNLEPLEHLKNLETLLLYGFDAVTDFTPLEALANLRELVVFSRFPEAVREYLSSMPATCDVRIVGLRVPDRSILELEDVPSFSTSAHISGIAIVEPDSHWSF